MVYRIAGIDVRKKKELIVITGPAARQRTYSSAAGLARVPSNCANWRGKAKERQNSEAVQELRKLRSPEEPVIA